MDTLIHADIFFFVTTVVVVAVGIGFIVALVYLIKILSDIKKITNEVRDETVLFREDVASLRADIKREGFHLARFAGFFTDVIKRQIGKQWIKRKPRKK